jgi:LPXTG-site transpeptidase (sortase) family protein
MPDLSDGIFAELDQLQVGDPIIVNMGVEERRYVVTGVTSIGAHDLTPLYPTSGERLTLITCDTLTYNRHIQAYTKRVVVTADRLH